MDPEDLTLSRSGKGTHCVWNLREINHPSAPDSQIRRTDGWLSEAGGRAGEGVTRYRFQQEDKRVPGMRAQGATGCQCRVTRGKVADGVGMKPQEGSFEMVRCWLFIRLIVVIVSQETQTPSLCWTLRANTVSMLIKAQL